MEPVEDGDQGNDADKKLILQSDLLSGGLQTHMFAYFKKESLLAMEKDAQAGACNDIVANLREAIQAVDQDKFESQLTSDDKLLREIIHEGQNETVDKLCKAMQLCLKKKGGHLSLQCNLGQALGMQLTRAAFAVMIKFQGLLPSFQTLYDEVDMLERSEKDDALVYTFEEAINSEGILKCWANATKMRQWLNQKKQSIGRATDEGELAAFDDGDSENEREREEQLQSVCQQVVSKAEFLAAMETP